MIAEALLGCSDINLGLPDTRGHRLLGMDACCEHMTNFRILLVRAGANLGLVDVLGGQPYFALLNTSRMR